MCFNLALLKDNFLDVSRYLFFILKDNLIVNKIETRKCLIRLNTVKSREFGTSFSRNIHQIKRNVGPFHDLISLLSKTQPF